MDSSTSTTNFPASPETAPQVSSSARKFPGLILDIPTEVLRQIASNLDSEDLVDLSLTCRKAARGYDPMDDEIYLPEIPRMAMIPRLGESLSEAQLNIREDVLLYQLLCVSFNLRVLRLEVFGDILPVTPVPGGFQNLRSLFLRRLPHGYGETVSDSVDNSRNTSMKDLVWLLRLPRLNEVTLDNFGALQDVGSVSAVYPGQFTPKTFALVETSFADEPSYTMRAAIHLFLRAFKSLECMEWHLSRLHPRKARTIAWVVDGLQRHKDTLKTLVLSENKVRMAPLDTQDVGRLPPEEFLDISFLSFSKLEHLCVMDMALLSRNLFDPRSNDYCRAFSVLHKLPNSLKQLAVVPFLTLGPAIHIASIVRLWNELTNFLPAMQPQMIYCLAIPFHCLEFAGINIVTGVPFTDEHGFSRFFGSVTSGFDDVSPREVFLNSQAIMERYCLWNMRQWNLLARAGRERDGRRRLEALARSG
ncbi:uncharacterized protein J3D65DRAFT_670601 [Phyllosticta citribraziliensis]|uniref:F-box domain-containing protein n=1 Tax=Phyllosticta citribraziliensis TaxID=989973 RepID=A0ABR1L9N9_9PEZI